MTLEEGSSQLDIRRSRPATYYDWLGLAWHGSKGSNRESPRAR
jgi:hypothetical protein